MVDATAFDTLATARKLKAAGLDSAQAEAIAEAQAEAARAARSELASKADLAGLKADLRIDIAGLKADNARQPGPLAIFGLALLAAVVAIAITGAGFAVALALFG